MSILEQSEGMFREFVGIRAFAQPEDMDLYRSLIPEPFEVAYKPLVSAFIVDYSDVHPWPMGPYEEGAISLRVAYKGEPGWYIKTMPVNRRIPELGGRFLGFPKHVVSDIDVWETEDGWSGRIVDDGVLRLALDFEPGVPETLAEWQNRALSSDAFFEGHTYLLRPPDEGPRAESIDVRHNATPEWDTRKGTVSVAFGRDDPWSGLLQPRERHVGIVTHFKGAMNLEPHTLEK